VRGIRSKTRTDSVICVRRFGTDDCAGADCRWRLNLQARWVDNGSWIDGRHPDTDLILLEQVGDKVVEIDV
jgi:hypothetical protein